MLKQTLVLLFLAQASFVLAQGQTRLLTPRADSPTAMVRCGANLEEVKVRLGTMRPYTFTGSEVLRDMRYCIAESATSVVDSVNKYSVPAGTQGWVSEDGKKVVLQECVNDASCDNCPPPPLPAPVVTATPPPPAPVVVVPAPATPLLPICALKQGNDGEWLGLALNGEGKFSFSGVVVPHQRVDTMDTVKMVAPTNPGTHLVSYTVAGPGGSVVCEAKIDVFAQQTIGAISPVITLTAMRWCDTERDGLRPDRLVMGILQQARCHPGGTLLNWMGGGAVGFGLSRITHIQPRPTPSPAVGVKPAPNPGVAVGRVP